MTTILYSIATFLSAYLLFVIQPILAKKLLPWFGSSPNAWLSVILFFQAALLLGYLYAFLMSRMGSLTRQGIIQSVLILFCCLLLPIHLSVPNQLIALWPPIAIASVLALHVLFPVLLLSSASPLLQSWYCEQTQSTYPYYLYALSNAGALLGLFTFPFILEPFWGLSTLLQGWSYLFIILMISVLGCYLLAKKQARNLETPPPSTLADRPNMRSIGIWFTAAFLGNALLFSATQLLLQNVLSFPLLWIIPLALFLIAYILTFGWPKTAVIPLWLGLFTLTTILVLAVPSHHHLTLRDQLIVYAILIFSGCMVCQGTLIRYKPHPKFLTHFYLLIALGGVMGGLFVNLLAPLVFIEWWDFYLPLLGIVAFGGLLYCRQYFTGIPLKIAYGSSGAVTLALTALLFMQINRTQEGIIYQHRNFFGRCDVTESLSPDQSWQRTLRHGYIMHGQQFLDPAKKHIPTSYFSEKSGIGLALQYCREKNAGQLKSGIIGLGTGTLAALMRPHDQIHFYECDKDVITLAKKWFTYLEDTPANLIITLDDGRLALQKAYDQNQLEQFNILVIDAFNGDSLPTHLITLEALQLYLAHLQSDGILAINISNRYIDLYPQLQAAAKALDQYAYLTHSSAEPRHAISAAEWVLISPDPSLGVYLYQKSALFFRPERQQEVWTDDFNYLLSAIKWHL